MPGTEVPPELGYSPSGNVVPRPGLGYPMPGTEVLPELGYIPSGNVVPQPRLGYPMSGSGVAPLGTGVPLRNDLGPVTGLPAPETTWDHWKYHGMEMGYPSGCGQTHTCEISNFFIRRMRVVIT